MRESYPDNKVVGTETTVSRITELREDDITEFLNLPNRFIEGRKVIRIPSASTDVIVGDKEGDINYDASFLYILLDTGGGVLRWRQVALASF